MGAKQTKSTRTYSQNGTAILKRNKTFDNSSSLKQQQQQNKRKSTSSLSAYYYYNHAADSDLENANHNTSNTTTSNNKDAANAANEYNIKNSSSCTTSATTTTTASSSVSTPTSKKLPPVLTPPVTRPLAQETKSAKPANAHHSSNNPLKSSFKRFGISPRFKRKIVEAITKTNNTQNNAISKANLTNSLFANSKLFNALQSQLNLLSNSVRLINRLNTSQTMLSISLERNSLRYASRRKYKTQSIANPYRHANTNYPVFIHEALFLPEFSVKGKVTEADFEIVDVISRGAFGHVIKVKRKKLICKDDDGEVVSNDDEEEEEEDEIYAMKIMWKSQIIRDRALQQVKDEVTIAYSCSDNPFIVSTWWYWQSKRFLYIITSFIENGELLSLWLKLHHLPERLVAIYTIEMSLILDYLHNKGIVYRDIKMENILLSSEGHIKLIDFGLSKWLKLGEKTTTICGTIQYMSPEILSVEPYTHAVDWWSLGILVYALISGEYPLNAAKDHIQMCDKVNRHTFELDPNRYAPGVCSVVRKLLRKNPYQRMKTLSEVKNEEFVMNEYRNYLKETNQISDSSYWTPERIIGHYNPFQILADEFEKLKKIRDSLILENHQIDRYIDNDDDDDVDIIDDDDEDEDELEFINSLQPTNSADDFGGGNKKPADRQYDDLKEFSNF